MLLNVCIIYEKSTKVLFNYSKSFLVLLRKVMKNR